MDEIKTAIANAARDFNSRKTLDDRAKAADILIKLSEAYVKVTNADEKITATNNSHLEKMQELECREKESERKDEFERFKIQTNVDLELEKLEAEANLTKVRADLDRDITKMKLEREAQSHEDEISLQEAERVAKRKADIGDFIIGVTGCLSTLGLGIMGLNVQRDELNDLLAFEKNGDLPISTGFNRIWLPTFIGKWKK